MTFVQTVSIKSCECEVIYKQKIRTVALRVGMDIQQGCGCTLRGMLPAIQQRQDPNDWLHGQRLVTVESLLPVTQLTRFIYTCVRVGM